MATQGLVGIVPWTLIAQICNLFIQLWLIKKFLLTPVRNILAKRQEMTDAKIQEAEQAKNEAHAIKTEYEQNMKEAKEKANEILATAQKNANTQAEEILQEANQQVAQLKAKAERDIAQEKKKAVNELKDEIGDIAMEIAGKVIDREVKEADHEKLIDDFISNIGNES
ncbi:MAG: F0F1 ATP synthase subunit B [Lachnospiraceae bacterium]|nr:F0F1 ATP synthase subunit B [Lachnospiraceae bacterium]